MQQNIVKYLVDLSKNLEWMTNTNVKSNLELQDKVVDKTQRYIFQLLFDRIKYVALCAEKSKNDYSVNEYLNDIHSTIWQGVLKNRELSSIEKQYQNVFIDYLIKNISKNIDSNAIGKKGYALNLCGNYFQSNAFNITQNPWLDWKVQDVVKVNAHQDASIYWNMLMNIKDMLQSKLQVVSNETKEYYEFLLYKIQKTLDDK